jgi:twinkle protein
MEEVTSEYLYKTSCDSCGSSDANAVYSDGHTHCFSCRKTTKGTEGETPNSTRRRTTVSTSFAPIVGEVTSLPSRGITEETCQKFGYIRGKLADGTGVQAAPYYKDGVLVGQKTRTKDKDFKSLGNFKGVELFGQHLWRDGGKMVVVTEGEIDAMSVSQLQQNKWPVVSVPSGISGAVKAFKDNLNWLEKFEKVVIMFDNDPADTQAHAEVAKAIETCAGLLSPGKARIARLPLKDANEMLVASRGGEVIEAIWNAKEYRPDGLVSVDELIEAIKKPVEWGLPWWLDPLNNALYGRRYGEIYGFGAGTGVGKTDWLTQQIAYDITVLKQPVGLFFLETPVAELGKRIAGKIKQRLFHIPDANWTEAELDEGVNALRGMVTFYDNFGQSDWGIIRGHMRYMAAQGTKIFYLDHLTALADTADEKGSLEQIMKEMAGLANELKVIIHFVSHLTTPEKGSHEEGAKVKIREFKGSRTIGMWAHALLALERNQQAEDEEDRQRTTFRILKDRNTGRGTGMTFFLAYDRDTGMLSETSGPSSMPFSDKTATKRPSIQDDF